MPPKVGKKHPCLRENGKCAYGDCCRLAHCPRDACVPFLNGRCNDPRCPNPHIAIVHKAIGGNESTHDAPAVTPKTKPPPPPPCGPMKFTKNSKKAPPSGEKQRPTTDGSNDAASKCKEAPKQPAGAGDATVPRPSDATGSDHRSATQRVPSYNNNATHGESAIPAPVPIDEDPHASEVCGALASAALWADVMGAIDQLQSEVTAQLQDLRMRFEHELLIVVAKSMPNSSSTLVKAAKDAYRQGQYDVAVKLFTESMMASRADGFTSLCAVFRYRSAACFMAGMFREALNDCRECMELHVSSDPIVLKVHLRAAKCCVALGDLDAANLYFLAPMLCLEEYAAVQQRITHGIRALQKTRSGTSDSDVHFKELVRLFPEYSTFYLKYAHHLMQRKEFQPAEVVLQSVPATTMHHHGKEADVALMLAKAMYMQGFEQFERARMVLEQIRTSTQDTERHDLLSHIVCIARCREMGNERFHKQQYVDAVRCFTDALNAATMCGTMRNDRVCCILYSNRAAAQLAQRQFDAAAADCTASIRLDPTFFKAYARRARCYQHLGKLSEAIQDFKEASKLAPGDNKLKEELREAEEKLQAEDRKAHNRKDYYVLLEVTARATKPEIRRNFLRLALKWHPDKNSGDESENMFKLIHNAYEVLHDDEQRLAYDRNRNGS